jgi:lipopolysaccharide biosynthesis glycosyltransferase
MHVYSILHVHGLEMVTSLSSILNPNSKIFLKIYLLYVSTYNICGVNQPWLKYIEEK